jgi:hypothetical protein
VSTESSVPGYSPVPADEPSTSGSSTADVAKDQASTVAGSVGSAGQHVAGVARDEAGNVAAEAKGQAKNVLGQARAELTQQASDQQQRVAGGLRTLGTELGSMADNSQDPGYATDLTRQVSTKAHEIADWLENRDPSSLLEEVKTFARQRPGTFLGLALVAGVAAGRLTRGLKDESSTATSSTPSPSVGPATATGARVPTTAAAAVAVDERAAADAYVSETPAYADPATLAGTTAATGYTGTSDYTETPAYVDELVVEKTTYTDGERR